MRLESQRILLHDLRHFVFHRPKVPTRVAIDGPEQRQDYESRILQRVGVRVEGLTVLNIHRIGIEAPVGYVFEQLLTWGAGAPFWPNDLATVERLGQGLERMRVLLLGREELPFGLGDRILGFRIVPLFRLNALRIQSEPDPFRDNARYLLYECSGGYPIGFLALYVRSPIPSRDESEPSQLFFVVGFDFYGRKDWGRARPLRRIWEAVHNRVTGNVLNRFKQICEERFRTLQQNGTDPDAPPCCPSPRHSAR